MFNLAIECSAWRASVALCHQQEMVAERLLPAERGAIETLAPAIQSLVGGVSLSCLSITSGPGSFTGLRIGLATAKVLALAWGIPAAPVDTLHAIAEQQRLMLLRANCTGNTVVVAGLNAFRNQVFTAAWLWEPTGNWRCWAGSQVVDASVWMKDPFGAIAASDQPAVPADVERVIVTGPALERYSPAGTVELPHTGLLELTVAPPGEWIPRAAIVGSLGWKLYLDGLAVSADRLLPNYLRTSAAEEKLNSITKLN